MGSAISPKLIAVVAVVVIAAAAVGAVALMGDDNNDSRTPTSGLLQVYGNANQDDTIDSSDLDLIQRIIDDDMEWSTEHPFADANGDGKVDSQDKALVQRMIDREPCTIRYVDGRGMECEVAFPLERIVLAGTMVHPVVNALGADDKAVGMTGPVSKLNPLIDTPSFDLPQVGSDAATIDAESLSKVGQVDAVITLSTSVYDSIEEALKGTGIPTVRINPDDTASSIKAHLLIGFLTDTLERAHVIVAFYDRCLADITERLPPVEDRSTGFAAYGYNMCGKDYNRTRNVEAAGIVNLSDFPENVKKLKDNNEWALVEKYQGDYIIQLGENLNQRAGQELKTLYDTYGIYFSAFDAYKEGNYVVVNKTIDDVARVAFIAAYVYPEIFGEDYGYEVYQELVETFFPYVEDFDVHTDGTWIITYDDAYPSS